MAEVTQANNENVSIRSLVDFLMATCRLSVECGCSSNRVELLVTRLAEAWGFTVDTAALPTAVWLSVRGQNQQILELVRLNKWGVDLNKLALLNDLVDLVEQHKLSLVEATSKLDWISKQPPPYPKALVVLAGAGSSFATVASTGGLPIDLFAASVLGAVAQLTTKFFSMGNNRKYLVEFVTAIIVAAIASVFKKMWPETNLPRLIIGGLISLVPGLAFVNSLHEVAQKNLVSGAARFLEAIVTALSLAFGVASVLGFVHYLQKWGI